MYPIRQSPQNYPKHKEGNMSKNKVTTKAEYKGHPVNAGTVQEFSYSTKILDKNQELLDSTLKRHNKVLCYRMDLRFPDDKVYENPTQLLSSFMNVYTNGLSRKGYDPAYAARLEQETSVNPHLHVEMLVDGNRALDYIPLVENAEERWNRLLSVSREENGSETNSGLVDFCNKKKDGTPQKNGIMVRRNSPHFNKQYDQVHQQMSYIAKNKEEDVVPAGVRKISYSRYKSGKGRNKD